MFMSVGIMGIFMKSTPFQLAHLPPFVCEGALECMPTPIFCILPATSSALIFVFRLMLCITIVILLTMV